MKVLISVLFLVVAQTIFAQGRTEEDLREQYLQAKNEGNLNVIVNTEKVATGHEYFKLSKEISEYICMTYDYKGYKSECRLPKWRAYFNAANANYYLDNDVETIKYGKLAISGMNKVDKAKLDAISLMRFNVERSFTYEMIGASLNSLSDYSSSIKILSEGLVYYPTETNLLLIRGIAYYNIDNKDMACQDFNKAIELGDAAGYDYRGRASCK